MKYRLFPFLILIGLCSTDDALGYLEWHDRVDVPLYYDPATGNLTIDATDLPGGRFSGYTLDFNYDGFGPFDPAEAGLQPIRADEYTPFMSTFWFSTTEWSLGESKISGSGVPAGVYSIGNVLPAGLTRDEAGRYRQVLVDSRPDVPYSNDERNVLGTPGDGVGHYFQFIYGQSPFPPLNVGDEWGAATIERWAESASLIYDPNDGGLTIDLTGDDGGTIMGYQLTLDPVVLNAEAWQPVTELAAVTNENTLAEFTTVGISEGRYDLGTILSPGLSDAELNSAVISSLFIGEPGHSNGPFDVSAHGQPMLLTVVPEPTSGVVVLWVVVLFGRLRKQSCHRRGASQRQMCATLRVPGRFLHYKTTHPRTERRPQLFDLIADPSEDANVARDNPDVVKRMADAIGDWYPVREREVQTVFQ